MACKSRHELLEVVADDAEQLGGAAQRSSDHATLMRCVAVGSELLEHVLAREPSALASRLKQSVLGRQ
jgi:hypothetical protein